MIIMDYNGRSVRLFDECLRYLEMVAIGMARDVSGNWRNNNFHMRIYEKDGVIRTSAHGLGKIYRENEILLKDILDESNREEYDFYRALYNLISYLNNEGIVADEITFDFIPGRGVIVGDLMDVSETYYKKNTIKNLKASVWG